MGANVVTYPFCAASFFDRFEVRRTVLFIRFLKRIVGKNKDEKEETHLVEREAVGIYSGREEDVVRLQTGETTVMTIPSADLRGIKEIKVDELEEIVQQLVRTLCRLPVADTINLPATLTAINGLRAMIDQHSLLIPRAPMA